MARCKSSDSRVQGKKPVVLDKNIKVVEAASSPHGNDGIMYMRLGTHARKCFFDDWESSMLGDSCLNRDKSWLVDRGGGGGAVKPCTYDRIAGLFRALSQEQRSRGYLTL